VPSGKEKKRLRQQLEKLEWEFMEATLKEQEKHEALEHLQKLRRVSAKPFFLWKLQFMEVFREKGGFDVVIMNPPYGAEFTEVEKELLKKKHENISERIRNSFLYFMGLGNEIVKQDGVACLILPNEFLFQIYMTKARRFFVTNTQVLFAVNTGEDVFEAIVPTCIIALKKHRLGSYGIPVADLRNCQRQELSRRLDVDSFTKSTSDIVLATPNSIFAFDLESNALVNKLTTKFAPFGDYCDDVANGISTSCDEIYIVTQKLAEREALEKKYLKQCIRGGQFNRFYCPPKTKEYLLYITEEFDPKVGKNIHRYLSANKALLIRKCVEKKEGLRQWNILFRARYEALFKKPKMLIRQTADRIVAAPDTEVGYYCIDSVNVALLKEAFVPQLNFLVGLLNSALLNFYYREISQEGGRVLAQVKPQRIRCLPIPAASPAQQQPVERLVERIMSAKQRDADADVSTLEREIDQLVYALYGLTLEEIKIVEGDSNAKSETVKAGGRNG
jgi:adenine-specific DNA-methyltransferase